MFTHEQIWLAIDKLADGTGLSTSGLAKLAGLDPTSFNKSKRQSAEGKPRWPSTESLSKVLNVTNVTMVEFIRYVEIVQENPAPQRPLMEIKNYNVRLPNGVETSWSRLEAADISIIIPLNENNEVTLIKQFRLSQKKEILELPSGRIDLQDANPEAAAKRELAEETGLRAQEWHFLKSVSLFNHASITAHFFLARGLQQGQPKHDPEEVISVTHIPLDKAMTVLENYGSNAQSTLGLYLAKDWLSKNS